MDSRNVSKQTLPELPLPNVDAQLTRCLTYYKGPVLPPSPESTTSSSNKRTRTVHAGVYTFQKNYTKELNEKWSNLEQKIVQHVTGELPYPFKPFTPCLSSNTQNKSPAVISCQGIFISFKFSMSLPTSMAYQFVT